MKTFYAHGFRPASGFHGGRLGAPFPVPDFDITLPPLVPGDLVAPAAAPAPTPMPTPVPAPVSVEFFPQPVYPPYGVYATQTPPLPVAPTASEYKIPTYVWAGGAALAAALVVALVLAGKKS